MSVTERELLSLLADEERSYSELIRKLDTSESDLDPLLHTLENRDMIRETADGCFDLTIAGRAYWTWTWTGDDPNADDGPAEAGPERIFRCTGCSLLHARVNDETHTSYCPVCDETKTFRTLNTGETQTNGAPGERDTVADVLGELSTKIAVAERDDHVRMSVHRADLQRWYDTLRDALDVEEQIETDLDEIERPPCPSCGSTDSHSTVDRADRWMRRCNDCGRGWYPYSEGESDE